MERRVMVMDVSGTGGRRRRYRQFVWIPRGPAGIALFVVVAALLVFLLILLSLVVLTAAIAAAAGFALYQGARRALGGRQGGDRRVGARLRRGYQAIDGQPLEQYLSDIEAYDHLVSRIARFDLDTIESWRGRRALTGIAGRVDALRESALAVERSVAQDLSADAARPGLWELIVAVTELQRYNHDLRDFPTTRGRAAQTRELQALSARRDEITHRRDELIRRLQQTDLRGVEAVRP
ncbi:MAG: hypothetical protein ACYDCQ_09655 [Dehalococcoidia bacterium]